MAAAIIVAGLLITAGLLVLGHVLAGRPEDHVNPRRRELRRARAARSRAERTLREVRTKLDHYAPVLFDEVGVALVADVRELLTVHDQEMMELDR